MANADAVNQEADIQIPRRGEVMAKTVDTTTRAINLQLLAFNDAQFYANRAETVFLNLKNQSATSTIFFFAAPDGDVTTPLDPAAVLAATDPASFPNTHGWYLSPGEERSYRIHRDLDLFLHVRTDTGSAILRLGTTSSLSPRVR